MNPPGHGLLAGTALPRDQDGGVGPGHAVGHFQDPLHRGGDVHDVPLHSRRPYPQIPYFRVEAFPLEGLFDGQEQLVPVERLPDEVVRPLLHRLHRRFHVPEGGDDEHGGILRLRPDAAQHLDPGNPRHLDIRDHQVELLRREGGKPFHSVGGGFHLAPCLPQVEQGNLPSRPVVVDEENASGHRSSVSPHVFFPAVCQFYMPPSPPAQRSFRATGGDSGRMGKRGRGPRGPTGPGETAHVRAYVRHHRDEDDTGPIVRSGIPAGGPVRSGFSTTSARADNT